ncbi:MAG: DUF3416 domain-containing protein, partial [Acidisphaera sp.]|nr:DUF3416 domain-containing protein [Acidisphaera sp.]
MTEPTLAWRDGRQAAALRTWKYLCQRAREAILRAWKPAPPLRAQSHGASTTSEGEVMDQSVNNVDAAATAPLSRPAPVRIYYLDPLLAGPLCGWTAHLERAAELGFSHVLTAPLFDGPSLLLASSFDRPHEALQWRDDSASALRRYAELARAAGLTPLMDLSPARVAAGGQVAAAHPDLFEVSERGNALDPRSLAGDADAANARWTTAPAPLVAFWTQQAQSWRDAGVAGFRVLLADVPPAQLASLMQGLHEGGCGLLFGWTPGLPLDRAALLEGADLDGVFASLPWWDYRQDWLWHERAALSRIAPVIASVEAPFGPRLAASVRDPRLLQAAQARAIRFAVSFGDGWLMPMGFEWSETRPMDRRQSRSPRQTIETRIADEIRRANQTAEQGAAHLLTSPDTGVAGILRADGDPRFARGAKLEIANLDLERRRSVAVAPLLAAAGGRHVAATDVATVTLAPAEVVRLELAPSPMPTRAAPISPDSARDAADAPRVGIENVSPSVDNGRFAAKRLTGEVVAVEADLICDGHDQLAACVQWQAPGETAWRENRMQHVGNDRWRASFPLRAMGRHRFRVQAWRDAFATFREELRKKHEAHIDVSVELIEGRRLVAEAGPSLTEVARAMSGTDQAGEIAILLAADTTTLMAAADQRPRATTTATEYPIEADRREAEFASWYEIFPRSMSDDPARHGTFDDVIRHLPRIRDMGFDVLYFPPIHPIGQTNRKGRNNALKAGPDDPGSPYAIGSEAGGHDAIHKELGTLADFERLRDAAAEHGLEIALDFAIQCSPDHPWLKRHPKWFAWRPDGSIRYAENPPKKYEDIVNVDFYAEP